MLLVVCLLPTLGRPREPAQRIKCASNLRQIGQGILLYCNDHGGEYPDSFATILVNEDLTPGVLICPDSDDTPAAGATTQALNTELRSTGHCSYIYIGDGLNSATVPANAVVAYEPTANHGNSGSNVLFGDGHVQFMSAIWMTQMTAKLAVRSHAATTPVTMPTGSQ